VLDRIHVIKLRRGSEEKLSLLIIHAQGCSSINDIEAPKYGLPSSYDVNDSESEIVAEWKKQMINGREGARNESNERVVSEDKELHRTRVPLLDTGGKRYETKEEVSDTDDPLWRTMQGSDNPPESFGKVHYLENPEQISPRQGGKCRLYIKSEDTRVWHISDYVFNDLGLKREDEINHLMPFHTSSLIGSNTWGADTREYHRNHAGNDFTVCVGKT
jgi:hypothetical protein